MEQSCFWLIPKIKTYTNSFYQTSLLKIACSKKSCICFRIANYQKFKINTQLEAARVLNMTSLNKFNDYRFQCLTLYCLNSFFRSFSGHRLRYVFFVCLLIVSTLIGNFLMIPSKIKIKIFALRCIFAALGTKGLN